MSDQQSLHGQRKRVREEVGEDDEEKKPSYHNCDFHNNGSWSIPS